MQATIATLSIDLLCKQCYKASMLQLGARLWKNSPIYWLVLNSELAPTRTGFRSSKRNVVVWTTKLPRSRNTWSWQKHSTVSKPTRPNSRVSPVSFIPMKKAPVSDRILMSPTNQERSSWDGASIQGKVYRRPRTKCFERPIGRCTQKNLCSGWLKEDSRSRGKRRSHLWPRP